MTSRRLNLASPLPGAPSSLRDTLQSSKSASTTEYGPKVKKTVKRSWKSYWRQMAVLMIIITIVLTSPLLYLLLTRLGISSPFPDQPKLVQQEAILPSSALEVVAELPIPPGNIAVGPNNRIFFTFHPEYSSHPHYPCNVAEVVATKSQKTGSPNYFKNFRPYPAVSYQKEHFKTILSLRIDEEEAMLWLLDHRFHGLAAGGGQPRLFAYRLTDPNPNPQRERIYVFPSAVAGKGSFLNDFAIYHPTQTGRQQRGVNTADKQTSATTSVKEHTLIVIADTSILALTPAVVVYDVTADRSYRLFACHSALFGPSVSMQIASAIPTVPRFGMYGPFGLRIHVDGIALDCSKAGWLYLAAVSSDRLAMLPWSAVLDHVDKLAEQGLSSSTALDANTTSRYLSIGSRSKPLSDGLIVDDSSSSSSSEEVAGGYLYTTSIEQSALFISRPLLGPVAGSAPIVPFVKLISSPRYLRWPDGLSLGYGKGGSGFKDLYVTASMLHYHFTGQLMPRMNNSDFAPYHILKISGQTLKKHKKKIDEAMLA